LGSVLRVKRPEHGVKLVDVPWVRKAGERIQPLHRHLRWAVLKRVEVDQLTTHQLKAMAELIEEGLDTATGWRVKDPATMGAAGQLTASGVLAGHPVHQLRLRTGR
jgi:hypothetical protein